MHTRPCPPQVNVNDTWGTVCSSYFSPEAGVVACRELGFAGPGLMYSPATKDVPSGDLPVMDGMVCSGDETRLQVRRRSQRVAQVSAAPRLSSLGWPGHACSAPNE